MGIQQNLKVIGARIARCVREVTPNALHTAWWLVKMMLGVTFGIMLLQYMGWLPWLSVHLQPVFSFFGLPGQAALAYVSGYFVNCYSAIAVAVSLHLDARSMTILAVMVLCSHNMIVETAVQKKTGTSVFRVVFIRTFSAFLLGWVLHRVLPGEGWAQVLETADVWQHEAFKTLLQEWAIKVVKVIVPMVLLVFLLTVVQRLLSEFGVIDFIARFLRPLMYFFGLPPKTAFMWIVANILGLAYGAGIMVDEVKAGHISLRDADLLNNHIGISHSNLEDLLLFTSIGAWLPWMLLSRWALSWCWVWERRLERVIGTWLKNVKRPQKSVTA